MRRFDDFDAWGEAVSGASLALACDHVEDRVWTLGILGLGDVVLQVASEGGGNLCYGGNTHVGMTLFVPLTHAAEHFANGTRLDDDSLLAIPSGADFTIRLRRRPHSWCSIALPAGFAADGLPLGVQIVGRPFAESSLLHLGHRFQQATDWHRREPPVLPLRS